MKMRRWLIVMSVVALTLATAACMQDAGQTAAVGSGARANKPPAGRSFESTHYAFTSTATRGQTRAVAVAMEALYLAYTDALGIPESSGVTKLPLVLYGNRAEFAANNRSGSPWAEAYYRAPVCYAYLAEGRNPYHWMVHEGAHQLNHQLARFAVPSWINEGLATYFGTSRIVDGKLRPGVVDPDTYPIWWVTQLTLSGNRQADLANGRVLSLRTLMAGEKDDIDRRFNLYYIGYWSLSHFLLHYRDGRYAMGYKALMKEGGSREGFERLIGPIDRVEAEWYDYLREQVDALRSERRSVA